MKKAYPVIIRMGKNGVFAYIHDFDIHLQVKTAIEVTEMCREEIHMRSMEAIENYAFLPLPTPISDITVKDKKDMITLVTADVETYIESLDAYSKKDEFYDPELENTDYVR